MLKSLQSFVSNGQAVGAVTALVIAIFGVLTVTGTVHSSPDAGLVQSAVVLAFTLAGVVLTYVQHSQTTQKAQQAADLAHVALALGISAPELAAKLTGTYKAPEAPAPSAAPASTPATQ